MTTKEEIVEGYKDMLKAGQLPPVDWLKQALSELEQSIREESEEKLIRKMEKTMIEWSGTARAMLKDFRKIHYATPSTSEEVSSN